MKKFIMGWVFFFSALSAFALPVGNPWDASLLSEGYLTQNGSSWDKWGLFRLRVGFYGDYIFNQHLQVATGSHSTIQQTNIYTNAGYAAVNVCNRFDLFTTLGASHIYITTPSNSLIFTTPLANNLADLETDTAFSWSIGVRATLLEWGCFGIGAEGQYFRTVPRVNYTNFRTLLAQNYPTNYKANFQEWQIGLGAAYRINIYHSASALVPYVAVKWSRSILKLHRAPLVLASGYLWPDLEKERGTGYAIGLTLIGCNKANVTVEGRFVDETAVHVKGQISF